uniref:NADH-ubiquinone oxidoreductase chain 2 n=1 Tax=Symphurus orientalis TaxID=665865 RepID=A0A0K0Q5Y2_9PLEU|nr:NADH dehydrogenase subunit 2 [Symphurus orientalis]
MSEYVFAVLFSTLGAGIVTVFASSHWLIAWIGLEVTTLAILPLMAKDYTARTVEAATKYYLAQSIGAAMIVFAALSNAWISGQWTINELSHPLPSILMILALSLKLGLVPLHGWVPEVLQGLKLHTGMILATFQKLAPFALLVQMQHLHPQLLAGLGFLSILWAGLAGHNQAQLRKILAYSSISHMGWMTVILAYSTPLAYFAFIMYLLMTFTLFQMFNLSTATSINMLTNAWSRSTMVLGLVPFILLTLAGLPPLSGFMPKLCATEELTKQGLIFLVTCALLVTLLSFYYYLRLTYAITMAAFPNAYPGCTFWRFLEKNKIVPLSLAMSASISFAPITPILLSLLNS